MELNYLYHRHEMSLCMAAGAACERSRDAHRIMAAAYTNRIANVLRTSRTIEI